MSHSALAIVSHTPVYVWFLLAVVLLRAWQATRPRTVGLAGPIILPAVVVVLGVVGLVTTHASALETAIWLGALLLGGLAGRPLGHHLLLRAEAGPPLRLHLRGSLLVFALILVIFALRYGMAVFDAVAPATSHLPVLRLGETAIRGTLSGVLIGRGLGVLLAARALRARLATAP